MICNKRIIDTFDKENKRKVIKMPTERVEYYSDSAGFGYGLGELQMNKELFSVKPKMENARKY
ncbi:MAG: hypothetical protein HFG88_15740 [Dorea sp.]|nr:hypothetical protein [Dorea sp.]